TIRTYGSVRRHLEVHLVTVDIVNRCGELIVDHQLPVGYRSRPRCGRDERLIGGQPVAEKRRQSARSHRHTRLESRRVDYCRGFQELHHTMVESIGYVER